MTVSDSTFENPQTLLRESRWLQQLARGLCDDRQLAEDLSQDALAAAWESRSRILGPLRPWLAGALRRLLANRRRAQARRVRRERAAVTLAGAAESAPGTDEVVARAALHESVVQAVLTLDEPYRTAVLLRYFDELSCAEIATRLGDPVETVRTRVKRGVAQLRERLDSRHGARAVWVGPLAAIAWPEAATAAAAATTSTGWLVMLMNWKIVAATAVVIGVGLVVAFDQEPAPQNDRFANAVLEPVAAGRAESATPDAELGSGSEPASSDAERSAVAAPVTRVRGRFVFAESGAPAEGIAVLAIEVSVDGARLGALGRTSSTEDGTFELQLGQEVPFSLVVAPPGRFPLESQMRRVALGSVVELGTMGLVAAVDVAGRVRDTAGRAVPGFEFVLAPRDDEETNESWLFVTNGPVTVTTDDAGAFRLPSPVREGSYWVTTRGSELQFTRDVFRITPDQPFLELVVERDRGTIRGVVVDAEERPLGGVEVAAHDGGSSTRSGDDGAFELRWRRGAPENVRLRVWRRRFRRSELLHESTTAFEWGETEARVAVPALASLRLQVVAGETLRPIEVFDLDMQREGADAWVPDGIPSQAGASGARHPDGVITLDQIVPGRYRVLVVQKDRSVVVPLEVFSGERDARLVLPAFSEVVLTIRGRAGTPVGGARCDLFLEPAQPKEHSVLPLSPRRDARGDSRGGVRGLPWPGEFLRVTGGVTQPDGSIRLVAPRGSKPRLRVSASGLAPHVEVLPVLGESLTREVTLGSGGLLRGRLSPVANVARLADPFVCLRSRSMPELFYPGRYWAATGTRGKVSKDGTFELQGVPPGDWQACLGYLAEGRGGARVYQLAPLREAFELADRQEREIVLDTRHVMPVRVTGVVLFDGVALPHAQLQLEGEGFAGQSLWGAVDCDGAGRFEAVLAPGSYRLVARTTATGPLVGQAPVVVVAGRDAELSLTVTRDRATGR
ncbi:MAG: sigma-70 family RNA polymerase sigma factor [bacterium]|nr:sigma-70 family RNA polymerase sigma factor [bacterium]